MDVVILPLLNHSETVANALERMRAAVRSGIVRRNTDDTHTLFYAGDLLRASAKRVRTLGGMRDGEKVVLLDTRRARRFRLDVARPHRTAHAYEVMLAATHADYALVGATYEAAMIVTISEDRTADLSMTGGYECTGTPLLSPPTGAGWQALPSEARMQDSRRRRPENPASVRDGRHVLQFH